MLNLLFGVFSPPLSSSVIAVNCFEEEMIKMIEAVDSNLRVHLLLACREVFYLLSSSVFVLVGCYVVKKRRSLACDVVNI